MVPRLALIVGAVSFLLASSGCVKNTPVVAPTDVVVGGVKAPSLDVGSGAEPAAAHVKWEAHDEVEVEWRGRWYPAVILTSKGENRYLVHYDGYGDEWDEVVTTVRIRLRRTEVSDDPPDPAATDPDP